MPITEKNLKDCYLLGYKVSVNGGIHYKHLKDQIQDPDEENPEKQVKTWEGERTIDNKDEYRAAQNLRNTVNRAFAKLGAPDLMGIICPLSGRAEQDQVYREHRSMCDQFNNASGYSKVTLRVRRIKIEGENEEALKDMLFDLRELLEQLKVAELNADVKSIRDVVKKLQGYKMVLPDSAADYLERAVEDAQAQARSITKSLEKKGKTLADVQKEISTSAVDFARFAVMEPGTDLDVDDDAVARLVAAQAGERAAGMLDFDDFDEGEDDTAPAPDMTPDRAPALA